MDVKSFGILSMQIAWKVMISCVITTVKVNEYQRKNYFLRINFIISRRLIGIFESPKCDVNPQPNTRGIGPLVGRTSGNRRSVMHVFMEIFSITYNFSFICQYILIWLISSGREIFPLLKYPGNYFFEWTTKIWAQVKTTLLPARSRWQWWLLCQPIQAVTSRRTLKKIR